MLGTVEGWGTTVLDDDRLLAIDLFSGAGGLSEGLRLAGFDICLAVESELDPYLIYTGNNRRTPVFWKPIQEVKRFKPILHRMGYERADIALVAGGPPCQGFSMANTRTRGMANGHSKLVNEFVRVVEEIKPPAFLMENVLGILGMEGGEFVPNLLRKFESIGYEVSEWRLDASEYGVPQRRRRVFLVGSQTGKIEEPKPTHGPRGTKPLVTVRDAIVGDLPQLENTTGSREAKYPCGPTTAFQKWLRKECWTLYDHVTTECGDDVVKRFDLIGQGENLHKLMEAGRIPDDLKITIDHSSVYRRLRLEQPAVTIVNIRKSMLIHPVENRLLSLREAARLQSFQDRYRFDGRIGGMQQLIGDSVPPLLGKAVAAKVKRTLRRS